MTGEDPGVELTDVFFAQCPVRGVESACVGWRVDQRHGVGGVVDAGGGGQCTESEERFHDATAVSALDQCCRS